MKLSRVRRLASLVLLTSMFGFLTVSSQGQAVDEVVGNRKVKSKVSPLYPELARKMNLIGVVKVEIVIAPNGVVRSAKVIGGHPVLVDSAVDAAKKWRFEPGSEETVETVEFKFASTRQ